jgi:hypothetical protein
VTGGAPLCSASSFISADQHHIGSDTGFEPPHAGIARWTQLSLKWNSCDSSSLLTSFHRAIGQMPRFAVATKFQNVIVSGAQVRFSASSSACCTFNPLRYSNSNALFTSLRKARPNPARRSPITLSAATLFLSIAIEAFLRTPMDGAVLAYDVVIPNLDTR